MNLHWADITVFIAFFAVVVGVSMYKSRKERTGRGLLPGRPEPGLAAHRVLAHRRQHLDRAFRRHVGAGRGSGRVRHREL